MIETTTDGASPFIHHLACGQVTIEEIIQAVVASRHVTGLAELWDFGRAGPLFALSKIYDLSRSHDRVWLDQVLSDVPNRASAWLATSGLNRTVLEQFLDESGMWSDWRVFTDMNTAFHWLTDSGHRSDSPVS